MRAVVFDLDGVLVDSEELWDEVRRGLATEAGVPWPEEATRAMLGMSTAEWSAYMVQTVGIPATAEQVAAQVIGAMAAIYADGVPFMNGAVDAVARLAQRWPLGLASSAPRRVIDTLLDTPELTSRFIASVSTEEVAAGKPSPLVYLEAVRRLGIEPSEAAAIEDSSNGLRAAHAAGLTVIAMPNRAFPPAPDALALASATVDSPDGLTTDLIDSLHR